MPINYTTPIKRIADIENMSKRARCVCAFLGIDTLGALINTPMPMFRKERNCGRHTLEQIERIINKYTPLIEESTNPPYAPEDESDSPGTDTVDSFVRDVKRCLRDVEGDGHKHILRLSRLRPETVAFGIKSDAQTFLTRFCETEGVENRGAAIAALDTLFDLWLASAAEGSEARTIAQCGATAIKALQKKHHYEDYYFRLSQRAHAMLEARYRYRFSMLPARVINVFERYSFRFVLPYMLGTKIYPGNLRNCGPKTEKQMYAFLDEVCRDYISFCDYAESAENLNEWFFKAELEEFRRIFPFISESETRKMLRPEKEKVNPPAFLLLARYVRNTRSLPTDVYRLRFGLDGSAPRSNQEIATIKGNTHERIRQILISEINFPPVLEHYVNSLTAKLSGDVVPLSHPVWREFTSGLGEIAPDLAEMTPLQTAGLISSLSRGFVVKSFDGDKTFCLVNMQIQRGIPISKAIRDACFLTEHRSDSPIVRRTDDFLPEASDERTRHELRKIIAASLLVYDSVTVSEDLSEITYHPRNASPISVAESLMQSTDEPVSLDEIREEYYKKYPFAPDRPKRAFKYALLKDSRIVGIGRSERYMLRNRCGFNGTQVDLVVRILEDSPKPMRINEIIRQLKPVYPTAGSESIGQQLRSDPMKRFTHFENAYFGLASRTYPDQWIEHKPKSSGENK